MYFNTTTSLSVSSINDALRHYPSAATDSPFKYDTGKIVEIFRKDEYRNKLKLTNNELEHYYDYDTELGAIVKELVKGKNLELTHEKLNKIIDRYSGVVTGNAHFLSKQGLLSVKSLYYYKKKNWNHAITYTQECIVANSYLVRKGLGTHNLRCYEQNKNLAKILLRSGHAEEGYQLLVHLFDHMFHGVNNGLFGCIFDSKECWKSLPVVREYYAYETFVMVCKEQMSIHLKNFTGILPSDWCRGLDMNVSNADRQIIYNYIFIINQFHKEDWRAYIDGITYFLTQPLSNYYDILKLWLLHDLYIFLSNGDFPEADRQVSLELLKCVVRDNFASIPPFRDKLLTNLEDKTYISALI